MTKSLWLAGAVAGALGLVLLRGASGDPAPEAPGRSMNPSEESEGRTQADVERLRATLARAERRIAQLETAQPSQAAPAPAVASADPAGQGAQPAKFTDEERREHVAEVFEAERTDSSWHGEADARSLFRQVLPAGSTLQSVACRKSLCRVETSHPDAEARRAYVTALAMPNPGREMPFAGMLFDAEGDQADNDQTLRSVTYLVRAGYDLPNPR